MSEQHPSDRFDDLLDSLDASQAGAAPAPPPAFLRAVGRRRRSRMVVRAAATCVAVSVVLGLLVLSRPVVTPAPAPGPAISIARATISDTSALSLSLVNRDVAPEKLSLPDHPSMAMDLPLRVGDRFDAERMEEWLGQ